MGWLERRRKAKRKREGYRTGNTVVMPELDIPPDWEPPPSPGSPVNYLYVSNVSREPR